MKCCDINSQSIVIRDVMKMISFMCNNNLIKIVCLHIHLIVVVSGKSDVLQSVTVYDPFSKIQVGPHECDRPLPTAGHGAAFNQSRGKETHMCHVYCEAPEAHQYPDVRMN